MRITHLCGAALLFTAFMFFAPGRAQLYAAQPPGTSCSAALAGALTTTKIWLGSTKLPPVEYLRAVAGPGGEIAIAWSEGDGTSYFPTRSWLTRVDGLGKRLAPDVAINGVFIKGLVRNPAGYAVMVTRAGDSVVLIQLDPAGKPLWESTVVAGCPDIYSQPGCTASWTWSEDAMVWQERHNRFALQNAVQFNHGAQGVHEGDALSFFSADGKRLSGGWDYPHGCSHSIHQALGDNGRTLVSSCFSDVRPIEGTSVILLGEDRSAPVNYATWVLQGTATVTRAKNTIDPVTRRYLGSKEVLGELQPAGDGFWLAFASEDGRSSADAGIAHVRLKNGALEVVRKVWLTDTPHEDEVEVHLLPFGSGWLAAYGSSFKSDGEWPPVYSHLLELDASGAVLRRADLGEGVATDDSGWALRSYFNYANGDAGWVTRGHDAYKYYLMLARVSLCSPPSVALTSPQIDQPLSGSITIGAAAADDVKVERVEFSLDGILLGSDREPPYSYALDTGKYALGAHTIQAKAFDSAGNAAVAEAPVTFMASVPADRLDVNGDGHVTPLDALLIINQLNARGSGPVAPGDRRDVTRDGYLNPLDALIVINAINAQGSAQAQDESAVPVGSQVGFTDGKVSLDVDGTDSDDAVELQLGAPTRITVNGVVSVLDTPLVQLALDGGAGANSLHIRGSSATESVEIKDGALRLHSLGEDPVRELRAENFQTIVIDSGGGNDSAVLTDSEGSDSYSGSALSGKLTDGSYSYTITGFANVNVVGRPDGGMDTAVFYDSPAGEQLVLGESRALLLAAGVRHEITGFERVSAGGGRGDSAYLLDADGTDVITARKKSVTMVRISSGTSAEVSAFPRVFAYRETGRVDRVRRGKALRYRLKLFRR